MKTLSFPTGLAVAAVVLAFATGCTQTLCDLQDPATGAPISSNFSGTVADTASPQSLSSSAILQSVESISCNGFDRVVFTFSGSNTPGYFVEYIDKPVRACGSGNVVPVVGDGFLEIRMTPAQAHTEDGQSTIAERNRMTNHTNILQLVDTCDFEGNVTWVLGVSSPNAYRVVELSNPPRLVLDVKQ